MRLNKALTRQYLLGIIFSPVSKYSYAYSLSYDTLVSSVANFIGYAIQATANTYSWQI